MSSPQDSKSSLIPKLVFTGILVLASVLPSEYIQSLILERESTRESAINEVSEKWGNSQTISGPILVVPYQEGESKSYAYFLPEDLAISGNIDTEMRARGIYDIPVYEGQVTLTGSFLKPDMASLNIDEKTVLWDEAYLAVEFSDPKGLEQEIQLNWNGFTKTLSTQSSESFGDAMTTKITTLEESSGSIPFQVDLSFKGSNVFYFTPVGKTTTVQLTSNWLAPSFTGEFLPENYKITDQGFTAYWDIFYLNRNYPQAWLGNEYSFESSEAGVEFFVPADAYQMTTRAVKYMLLFVFLTFFVFFFIEVLNKQKLHPVQYLLVGFGLILFYLLLLSLSEHIGFGLAYLIAAVSIVGVNSAYSKSILGSKKLAFFVGAVLTALYGALYIILQLSDYALLIGSLLLFFALSVTMYLTRKVDWYSLH